MVYAIALPVHELLTVNKGSNSAYGFGKFFLPDVNGADGVIRTDNNSNKPEWKPSGPWNAKLPKHGSDKGVEIKHIDVTRDKVIINNHFVYDRAGFIALKAEHQRSALGQAADRVLLGYRAPTKSEIAKAATDLQAITYAATVK